MPQPRKRFHHYEVTPQGGWHGATPDEVENPQTPFTMNMIEDIDSAFRRDGAAPLILIDDATYDASGMQLVNIFPYYHKDDRRAELIVTMWNPADTRLYWYLVRHNGTNVVCAIAPSTEASGTSPTGFVNAGGTDSQGIADGAWQQSAYYDDKLYIGAVHTDADPVQHNVRVWDGTDFLSMPDDVWETDFETPNQPGFPRSRYMATFQRHVFCGYTEEGAPAERYPGRIRFSHADAAEYWHPDDWIQVGDNTPITGMYALRDILLIFKTNAVYGVYGSGRENWSVQRLSDGHGIAWGANAVAGEHAVYFWTGMRGLHAYDGNEFHHLMAPHMGRMGRGREIDTTGDPADLADLRNVRLSYAEGLVAMTIYGPGELDSSDPYFVDTNSTVVSRNLIFNENDGTMAVRTYASNGAFGTYGEYRGLHEIKEASTEQAGNFIVGTTLQDDHHAGIVYVGDRDFLGNPLDVDRDMDWCWTQVSGSGDYELTAAQIPHHWGTPWLFLQEERDAPHRWGKIRIMFAGHPWDSYYDFSGNNPEDIPTVKLCTYKNYDYTQDVASQDLNTLVDYGALYRDTEIHPIDESGMAKAIAYVLYGLHNGTTWQRTPSPVTATHRWAMKNFQVNLWPRSRGRT